MNTPNSPKGRLTLTTLIEVILFMVATPRALIGVGEVNTKTEPVKVQYTLFAGTVNTHIRVHKSIIKSLLKSGILVRRDDYHFELKNHLRSDVQVFVKRLK